MARRRVGSLCTGYGGLDMAVGGDVAWVSDIDKHAATLLEHRFPAAPNLGDLAAVDWSRVEPVDIITAGYPCQPFSVAGKRKGSADVRHIWPHIQSALRVLRPRFGLFENVAGHVGLGFADVLSDLAEVGFDAEWLVVRASDVGAPHRRERLFILATNADSERFKEQRGSVRAQPQLDGVERGSGATERPSAWGTYSPAVSRWERLTRPAPTPTVLTQGVARLNPLFVEWMMGLPEGWVTDVPGIPRNGQLHLLGNGVVPQQARAALGTLDRMASEQVAA